jgi:hypothetical protein
VTTLLSFVRLEGWRDSYIGMANCGEAGEVFSGDGLNIVFRLYSDPGRIIFRIIKPPQPILHSWQGTMFGKFKARCICADKHYTFQTGYHYITPAP